MKRFTACGLVCLALLCCTATTTLAAPPWQSFIRFRKVEADPNATYTLGKDQGPWMILAATFSGPDAADEARALVYEFRKTYKLEAFSHEKVFDYSGSVYGKGFNEFGDYKRMKHNRLGTSRDVAVMVGNFPSVDDPAAQETLEKIKSLRPKTLSNSPEGIDEETLQRRSLANFLRSTQATQGKGPMALAFVTANPLLPESYFRPGGVDKLVASMNSGITHSLLECKGTYTVKVATFKGQAVIDPKNIQKIENGESMKSRLEKAAIDAHRMCEALRAKNYPAYEFHDRYQSIVTVGSFNSLGSLQLDQSFKIDPGVAAIIKRFEAKRIVRPGVMTNGDRVPQSIIKLNFDMEPEPIEVPRRSFGSDYARPGLSIR